MNAFCPYFITQYEIESHLFGVQFTPRCAGNREFSLGSLYPDLKRCPDNCGCKYKSDSLHNMCTEGWTMETLQDLARTTDTL